MSNNNRLSALTLGLFICLGLGTLGFFIKGTVDTFKAYERSVTVKGLSEKEVQADIIIWPITFSVTSNSLSPLYKDVDEQIEQIRSFLIENGVKSDEITPAPVAITDRSAQSYSNGQRAEFRFTATQSLTIYSTEVNKVRDIMGKLSELGQKGIVFSGNTYQMRPQYLFSGLNQLKPEMIEEATTKAREVAEKFAEDSKSTLGKIKRASQGQFSVNPRDNNNPHIKKVRVVSTVEYYLVD